ncbi:cyclodeaminase/cyclohydrolase family protein [Nocardiopsis sp. MG754419]|uniref:cyclodeaminase/cyclohydrolase family protein n=1 Tax=Nocardiopsis sp. MG754419 TaxID=2259865 RepID=UPI002012F0FA|nr:cyclodeaminase/cyclohydrolase family protein [Nocardiopsis sp. MG754419]MBR8741103.1 formimidoyltetrahydrofolate cyclodeaminase [Nocardiopsis sp. MG754419]
MLSTEKIGDFLDRLSAREPTPGGGAAAALHAAQGAALVAMVARYSTGAKYADHADAIARCTERADALTARSLELADEDEAAFASVGAAYGLPRDTDAAKAVRKAAIARATAGAAVPPAEVVAVAREIVALAADLLPIGNRNVITDVAAGAEAARAAATTSRVNIEINLAGVEDPELRSRLETAATDVDALVEAADRVTARVREVIRR